MMTREDPTGTLAFLTRLTVVLVLVSVIVATTVIADDVVLATDRPMTVVVVDAGVVYTSVAPVPTPEDTEFLNKFAM